MFDTEASIQSWRGEMAASAAMRTAHLDELEDHLREELEQLRGLSPAGAPGLSNSEVFLIATRRLGGPEALTREFAKQDPGSAWRRRWSWMLAGYLGIGFAYSFVSTSAAMASSVSSRIGSVSWLASYSLGLLLSGACLLGLAIWIRRARIVERVLARHGDKLFTAKGISIGLLMAFLCKLVVGPFTNVIIARTMERGSLVGVGGVVRYTPYPQVMLWLAPFVVLGLLLWRDRERLRDRAADVASE